MPPIDDIRFRLNGATMLSKLDLNKAYLQLDLEPASRYITVFTTHIGLFQYKRLFFGLNSAAETFQRAISDLLDGIPNAMNISDDIVIYGKNPAEHDEALSRHCAS
jgi:hypothetical protein